MTILLSGSSGFIGSNLLKRIREEGYNLILLVRNKNQNKSSNKIKYIIEEDLSSLNPDHQKIDLIIHLATHFTSKHNWDDIDKLIDGNIKLGLKLLEIAKHHEANFINTSSFAQSISKTKSYAQNLYAQTKKSFQEILKYYCYNEEITAIDLELFDSYGPDDNRNKFYKLAIKDFVTGANFRMSEGNQEICLTHVNDIIEAIEICISILPKLSSYNAFTLLNEEQTYILRELALELRTICESSSLIENGFYNYRKNEIFKLESDYQPLPGWSPNVSLSKGIIEILKDKK